MKPISSNCGSYLRTNRFSRYAVNILTVRRYFFSVLLSPHLVDRKLTAALSSLYWVTNAGCFLGLFGFLQLESTVSDLLGYPRSCGKSMLLMIHSSQGIIAHLNKFTWGFIFTVLPSENSTFRVLFILPRRCTATQK